MKKNATVNLALLGIFSALIILMTFTPIGYLIIPVVQISATLIHIPVLVGAVVLGPKQGTILGAVFGVTSLIRAAVMPQGALDPLFVNPLVSVVPRVLVGLFAGLVFVGLYKLMKKRSGTDLVAAAVAAVVGTLTNTVLVIGMLCLLSPEQMLGVNGSPLMAIIGTIIGINGLIELGSAAVLVPAISKALFAVKRRMGA